jgi:hypothetical protein
VYFQLHGTRHGCHHRIVVFVQARLEGSHSDRILGTQTEFHFNSVARVERAKRFVEAHMGEKAAAYTLVVIVNFAASYGSDREFTRRAIQLLVDARAEKDEKAWWTAEDTGVYGRGESASVETTGLFGTIDRQGRKSQALLPMAARTGEDPFTNSFRPLAFGISNRSRTSHHP